MSKLAGVISLSDPFASRHGGTIRTRGFIEAVETSGFQVQNLIPAAPLGLAVQQSKSTGSFAKAKSSLGIMKRHFLPMPTVWGGRDSQLAAEVKSLDPAFLLISVLSQAQYAKLDRKSVV